MQQIIFHVPARRKRFISVRFAASLVPPLSASEQAVRRRTRQPFLYLAPANL